MPKSARSKRPLCWPRAPVNERRLVTEKLGFEHGFRQAGAVQPDEGSVLARRQIVNGAGEQLLAGTGFAAQQHGGVGARDDVDLIEHRANGGTCADDVDQRLLAMQGRSRRLLFEPALLFHQPFAIARDDVVEMQGLADHRADHRQKARVFLTICRVAFPFGAFDEHDADDTFPLLDRRADQGHRPLARVRPATGSFSSHPRQ